VKITRKYVFWFLAIFIVIALAAVLFQKPPTDWQRAEEFGGQIQAMGVLGVLVFLLGAAMATSIGLPRQFFAFVGGYVFGVPVGVLLSSGAALAGCAMTFLFSRYVVARKVKARYPGFVTGLNRILQKDAFLKIVVLRLQPLGTNLLTNLCAGVSNIRAKTFLASSGIGYLPQMFVFSMLGAGVRVASKAYIGFSLLMLILSLTIGAFLYKRHIGQS